MTQFLVDIVQDYTENTVGGQNFSGSRAPWKILAVVGRVGTTFTCRYSDLSVY
jgi:hypothetical protein